MNENGRGRHDGRRGFRFEHMWLQRMSILNTLKKNWTQTHMVESLDRETQDCREGLLQWENKEFVNILKRRN